MYMPRLGNWDAGRISTTAFNGPVLAIVVTDSRQTLRTEALAGGFPNRQPSMNAGRACSSGSSGSGVSPALQAATHPAGEGGGGRIAVHLVVRELR
jgi:hypothetical protein